jgi:formate hydrogenlyase subunit 3/multisubunit Na+/H+ antiporter MnhD subunit
MAVLVAASLLATLLGLARQGGGRVAVALGAWAALGLLVSGWIRDRPGQEAIVAPLGQGIELAVRVDAVGFGVGLAMLVPAALLLTFQARGSHESALAGLVVAAALLAAEAGGLLLMVLALSTAATLATLQLQIEERHPSWVFWGGRMAAWLALAWAGVILQVRGGTSIFSAIPVSALNGSALLLLCLAAVLCSGLLPWRTWVSGVWGRPSLRAGSLAAAVLVPLGFCILLRTYGIGAGRLPGFPWSNYALAALGALVALLAAIRALAAASLPAYLGELVAGLAGLTLMAIGLGTPLGLVAGVLDLLGLALLVSLAGLAGGRGQALTVAAVAVAAGLPPTLLFGSRLLSLQAALEASEVTGVLVLVATAAWVGGLAAGARALAGLPAAGPAETSRYGALLPILAALASGAGLGAAVGALGLPVARELMTTPSSAVGGGQVSVITASGSWQAVAASLPLIGLALLLWLASAALAARRAPARTAAVAAKPMLAAPAPLITQPLSTLPDRIWEWALDFRLPAEYRSLFDPVKLEAAMTGGRPLLWLGAAIALGAVVLR